MGLRLVGLSVKVVLAAWLGWLPMPAVSDTPADLESAREQLAAAFAAAVKAKEEFRTLLGQGGLTQSEKEDFQVYLTRLEQVVVENCETVLTLKASLGDESPETGCRFQRAVSTGVVSFPDERTEDERVTTLDGQLAKSMSDFDELLLREMEELKRRQSSAPDGGGSVGGAGRDGQGGAGGAGEDGQRESDAEGVAATDKGEESRGEGRTRQSQTEQKEQQQTASRQTGDEQALGSGGQNNEKTTASTKRDAPPEDSDDDIVARQLREAAESETDPELREKLWEEYRRYKADTAAKSD